jgi:acylphosphatase
MERIHLWVSRIVQDLTFSYYTAHKARELRLTAWVKNLRQGRVATVAEGPEETGKIVADSGFVERTNFKVYEIKVEGHHVCLKL